MDLSKLNLAVTEAEGAFKDLKQALAGTNQTAIKKLLGELQKKLKVLKDLSKTEDSSLGGTTSTAKKYVGWRVLHQAEGGYDRNPLGMPEVIPPKNPRAIEMTREVQEMSFALMRHFNPGITGKAWRKVHLWDKAFNNFTGFGDKKKPHRDFINDKDPKAPLPKYDKAQRLCGGQFIRGEVRGKKLVCVPGVHGIDARKPMPTIDEIVENNWYLFAITLFSKPGRVGHFPQGKDDPVAIPFIFDREIEFDLKLFDKWESDELPDPLKMYR